MSLPRASDPAGPPPTHHPSRSSRSLLFISPHHVGFAWRHPVSPRIRFAAHTLPRIYAGQPVSATYNTATAHINAQSIRTHADTLEYTSSARRAPVHHNTCRTISFQPESSPHTLNVSCDLHMASTKGSLSLVMMGTNALYVSPPRAALCA